MKEEEGHLVTGGLVVQSLHATVSLGMILNTTMLCNSFIGMRAQLE